MIEITEKTSLQSPHIYLQSAGSTGNDSTRGVHLRWMLKNGLSEHLPKADYAIPNINFNKDADFVYIYRAPYQDVSKGATVNFSTAPGSVNDSSLQWTYAVNGQMFYVHFLEGQIYAQVRASMNPLQNPQGFIASYFQSGGIIEIENQNELSFSVKTVFADASQATIKTELLSVENNVITAPKKATLRKMYSLSEINNKKLYSENIRSIRLQSIDTYPVTVVFELYSDLVSDRKIVWTLLDKYALTLDDTTAFQRLEPSTNIVNGKWLRYNDQAYVNTKNYKEKWNGSSVATENQIKQGVNSYIHLSDSVDNPSAIETFSYDAVEGPNGQDEASEFELSNLKLLQMASMDYHIARMLGLGVLDYGGVVDSGSKFVYIAEYVTFGDLKDGLGAREVHHLYCSLPTSLIDQRLPIPVDLKNPVPGMYTSNMVESPASITDEDGYSHDGKTRYLSLFNEDLPEEDENAPFFYKNFEFISSESTLPVYAGIEYKKSGNTSWRKPELPFNSLYENIDPTVGTSYEKSETVSIVIPDPGQALYVHREKQSGWHEYSSYGINWFGRATSSSVIKSIETTIVPSNDLLPPTNINAVLVQKESPLLLTSSLEQGKYDAIDQGSDKTLARVTFEYDHAQELIDYKQKIGNEIIDDYTELPDNEEVFAEFIDVFFRNRVPHTVSGKILSVTNHTNPLLSVIKTTPYELVSTGQEEPVVSNEMIIPEIPVGTANNFIGSIMVVDGDEYVVQSVNTSSTYPEFTVFKRAASGAIIDAQTSVIPDEDLESPNSGSMFLVVENMQNDSSWNENTTTNPSGFKINIDQTAVNRESVVIKNIEGTPETHVQKFRGIYRNATIKKHMEQVDISEEGEELVTELKHLGLYEVTFPGFYMPQHSQYAEGHNSVEFYNGTVRIHTLADPQGTRKVFKVVNSKNIGVSGAELTLYISDLSFPFDEAEQVDYEGKIIPDGQTSVSQNINYYPGYKVYLYQDNSIGLNETNVLPQGEEDLRYSVFGLRSHDNLYNYNSKLSMPVLMFAKAIREPKPPKQPLGGLYATRPDYFGKSTYTFTTEYESGHKPYAVQFGRASDIQILSTVYNKTTESGQELSTVENIMKNIFQNGNEEFYINRWNNFLTFNYPNGQFEGFPNDQGVSLPMPDSPEFIAAINSFIDSHNEFYTGEQDVEYVTTITSLNQEVIGLTPAHGQLLIKDFFKDAILNCFVPLTEIPVIYNHVNGPSYTPVPKKQKVRDRNGNLLNPSDPEFDMAPMMKIVEQGSYTTQFTDYGLDGASNAKYFYAAKELSMQMKSSNYSPILGPISMVNSSPATSPDVVKIISVLENKALQITPAIEFTVNAYPKAQHIKKVNLYRTNVAADSLSVRTMQLVKTIDLTEEMLLQSQWTFKDDFNDLGYVPYGDPLFYRITVSREIKYNDSNGNPIVDYAPSEVSKVLMANIVNNMLPDSPVLEYYSEPINQGVLNSVILAWDRTVYNGKYHLYKMNTQGNWVKVDTIMSNLSTVYYPIGDITVTDIENNPVYHHYKVLAENFSGMISTQENILTMYSEYNWQDIGGIGDMIVGGTFLIR